MLQLLMVMYYIVTDMPRWLPCERAVKTDNGYMLYKFDPETNVYTDHGYASSLEDLRFIMSFRYVKSKLFLVKASRKSPRCLPLRGQG
jgi:hypothetical protein